MTDGERSSLESWLEYHRATLLIKCVGLTPEQLVTRLCPPSPLSLLGLMRHMAEVESWFRVFDSEPTEQFLGEDGGIGGGAVPRGDAQGRRTGKRPVQGLAHPV